MLLVLSPAKNLDYQTPQNGYFHSQPEMLDDAQELIDVCRQLTPAQVGNLMKISDKLADLNVGRYQNWQQPFTLDNAKQAVLAFNGDVYGGLQATDFDQDDLQFAQQHLRILSGLYGLLKPMDLMQPYRLEMGTKLTTPRGKDLYQFWGDSLTDKLNTLLAGQAEQVLLNLASNEYFKAVKASKIQGQVISPVFKDYKNGQYKIISFYAKKARGLMARFVIKSRITQVEQLQAFNSEGYAYQAELSSPQQPVFTRKLAE